MDQPYQCGCHLNHGSPEEHARFWDLYKIRRQQQIAKREARAEQRERFRKLPAKALSKKWRRRRDIANVLRTNVALKGKEPARVCKRIKRHRQA